MRRGYFVNEQFFSRWSFEMAYVLGYLYADGSLERAKNNRGQYVRVSSTDKDRITLIKKLLTSNHAIYEYLQPGNTKRQFLLRIGSLVLFDALQQHGMTTNKSLTMTFPNIPSQYLASFILGYFDGDGCVSIERNTNKQMKRLLSVFTSGSKVFLTNLHEKLTKRVGITSTGLYKHSGSHNTFQLRYSTRDSLRIYQLLYSGTKNRKLALRRKYAIFRQYLRARRLHAKDFVTVFAQKGPVAK